MKKYKILQSIKDSKLVVVLRGETLEEASNIADACVHGGITALEVTFTIPKAHKLLENLSEKYREIVLGAGTVLDRETARLAILSGAKFIVSPAFDVDTAKLCNRYDIPYLPGCMTVNDMIKALEFGVSIVKLFPGTVFKPSFIKAIKGPLPQISIMPTGGINLDNIQDWLNAGAEVVGVGGEITKYGTIGNYEQIERKALQFIEKVRSEK